MCRKRASAEARVYEVEVAGVNHRIHSVGFS
jgi:hypothetical protein